jgi:hypothetical protein
MRVPWLLLLLLQCARLGSAATVKTTTKTTGRYAPWYGDYDDGDGPSAAFWVVMAIAAAAGIALLVMVIYWCCAPESFAATTGAVNTMFRATPYNGILAPVTANAAATVKFSVRGTTVKQSV